VHSYYVQTPSIDMIAGSTIYGTEFVSAIAADNIFAVQFHPEKSHKFGMQFLKNFIELPA
jgi:glutamine amidotransferase